jgi:hypothetical protein
MAATLTTSARRRLLLRVVLLAALCGGLWAWHRDLTLALRPTAITTGLVLLGGCSALGLFNSRKKLPFLPLLRAATWTQFHIYAGWFVIFLFLLHTGFALPTGRFEALLYTVFALVAVSGIIGLWLSRTMPTRLTMHGENVIYERIPALRAKLQREVEALVLRSVEETKSSTIADFYAVRLKSYFDRPRNFFRYLARDYAPLKGILGEVRLLERYTNERERAILAELTECLRAKENLDFQRAGQALLKYWLFVHIPLTASLLLLGALHGLMVVYYVGGLR